MKKSESLVATLLAIYGVLLTLCIAMYAIFKLLQVDIALATNLLLWSAAIFAPIAVLMTYTNWREQRAIERLAEIARKIYDDLVVEDKLIAEIVSCQNPRARHELLDTDIAKQLLKKSSGILGRHSRDLNNIKANCNNNDFSKVIERYLMTSDDIFFYLARSALGCEFVGEQGVDCLKYYEIYEEMKQVLFEISLYRA
jgi:hypothetical protein